MLPHVPREIGAVSAEFVDPHDVVAQVLKAENHAGHVDLVFFINLSSDNRAPQPDPLPSVLEEFLDDLVDRGYAEST